MANHKTTDQPGSNDLQPGRERSRNQNAQNSGGQRPNGEKTMTNANKNKQGPEDEHLWPTESKAELTEERGGHSHSGHSGDRNGSRK
ncbi:hypothetical protein EXU85_28290 [Spirosoma sp. KCTC 42546]|uniref:hypothetical protein n=1 Tax=Spirosoma sp. KCTC 42546 TaxID=2520506 RepID=UPI00115ABB5D|nr:hypothetical protein [Spirosoma sp. KCTC 42546]QDK82298.1 hypothetical protein EXU85_28290 [Spirosoma sp. KCTC 42546]